MGTEAYGLKPFLLEGFMLQGNLELLSNRAKCGTVGFRVLVQTLGCASVGILGHRVLPERVVADD